MKRIAAAIVALAVAVAGGAVALAVAAPKQPRALMVATAPTGETLTLTSDKWGCPSGETQEGIKWDARMVIYHDPRDGEKAQGCYVIDTQANPHTVVIVFGEGSLAGAPIFLPTRIFKPEI